MSTKSAKQIVLDKLQAAVGTVDHAGRACARARATPDDDNSFSFSLAFPSKDLVEFWAEQAGAAAASGGGGGGIAGHMQPVKFPPMGAVLPLREIRQDNSQETIGTLVIVSKEGHCVGALHCVNWHNQIYPDVLTAAGCKLEFVHSFPEDDIVALKLGDALTGSSSGGADAVAATSASSSQQQQQPAAASSSGAGSSQQQPPATAAVAAGSSQQQQPAAASGSGANSWPYVAAASIRQGELVPSAPVLHMGYAQCAEQEAMLSENQPLTTHGTLSHVTDNGRYALADYVSFPNCSGGAVVSPATGALLGIHVGELDHPAEAKPADPPGNIQAPQCCQGRPQGRRRGRKSPKKGGSVAERVGALEEKMTSKGTVGYFVPCTRLRDLLERAQILQPTAEEAEIAHRVLKRSANEMEGEELEHEGALTGEELE